MPIRVHIHRQIQLQYARHWIRLRSLPLLSHHQCCWSDCARGVTAQPRVASCPPKKRLSSRQVKGETTGEGKEEAIGQQIDLTADFGWPALQLRGARQRKGTVGELGSIEGWIEGYDAIARQMKMTTRLSCHVATGYELVMCLADPGKAEKWL